MELTEQYFRDRLSKLVDLQNRNSDSLDLLNTRLKEKGVEYCIVLPLFEVVLSFDPLEDIKMEHGSQKYSNQRFDFVVSPAKEEHYSLIVEAKSLSERNLKKHEEQIAKYMKENQEYPWGILTNGYDWKFYISKKYIETKFNDGRPISHFKNKSVFNIINLSLSDELFIEIMQSMKKHHLSDFWFNVAKYTYASITGGRGKRPVISPNKQINEILTGKIKEAVEIKTGEYWKLIDSGELKSGDKVICKNDFIELIFELDSGGRLVLHPKCANTHDLLAFTNNCGDKAIELLTSWQGSTNTFTETSQVILMLTGKKKCTQSLRDLFPFKPSL